MHFRLHRLYFPKPRLSAFIKSNCCVSPDKSQTATPSIPACFANAALRFSDSGSSYVTTWFVYGDTKNGVLEQESQKRVNPPYPTNVGPLVLVELLAFAGTRAPWARREVNWIWAPLGLPFASLSMMIVFGGAVAWVSS